MTATMDDTITEVEIPSLDDLDNEHIHRVCPICYPPKTIKMTSVVIGACGQQFLVGAVQHSPPCVECEKLENNQPPYVCPRCGFVNGSEMR
jgi:hypothetical protein